MLLLQYPICQKLLKVSYSSFYHAAANNMWWHYRPKDILFQGQWIFTDQNHHRKYLFYSMTYHVFHFIPYCYHILLLASADLKCTEIYWLLYLGHFLSVESAASKECDFFFFTLNTTNSALSVSSDIYKRVSSWRFSVFCDMKVSALCSDEDLIENVFFCYHQQRWSLWALPQIQQGQFGALSRLSPPPIIFTWWYGADW